ncbi:MAG TPA: hypothetical protein VJ978_11900 [Nitriliruptoraceae bacterium]|nr:hypothetical protein [Nitriliruptoraceae bacterium]
MSTQTATASPPTTSGSSTVSMLGMVIIVAGAILSLAGIGTWFTVQSQLAAESITVSDDAAFLAGDEVNGPFSAWAQADIINQHALESSDGETYATLDREDPVRVTMMNASFLRASLFTSVVAFGVAAMAFGMGILFILVGWALRKTTDVMVV